jgi:wyosine [tRNA(Phe)-imidazoG37] synthetase (radical SAM superfamily)
MLEEGTPVDSFTFSGDGESTIHPEFPRIIDDTLALRNRYFPQAKVSVLSNATQVHRREIFDALRKVDNPIMKIDAPTNELIQRINLPAPGYDIARVIEALKGFNGDFILQTMFLKSPDFDSSSPEVLEGWMEIVRMLKPREIMAYTIARPTPAVGLMKFTEGEMRTLLDPLIKEGFMVQIKG